jgi:hypothetical protein
MSVELFYLAKATATATIAVGASLSTAIRLDYHGVMQMLITKGSAWTAADVTFKVSHDGTTYYPLYKDDGTEVTIASADFGIDRWIDLAPDVFGKGFAYIKIQSGTNGANVNQLTDISTIRLMTRPL